MSKSRIISTIAGMMIIALSFSSCVYHSRGPAYDYGYNGGYGYGYRHRVPPPRTVVVVPRPPKVHYKDTRPRHHYNGRSNRNYNQYGHSGRSYRRN